MPVRHQAKPWFCDWARSNGLAYIAVLGALLAVPSVLAAQANPATPTAPDSQSAPPAQNADTPPAAAPASPAVQAAQGPPSDTHPIAIVPIDSKVPGAAAEVAGALHVYNGRAFIDTNAVITSGTQTTHVTLPYRGTLLVCASTSVKLAADTSAPPGGQLGLLMALDHGAVEMSFANSPAGSNADVLMTPDFRILIGGPAASEVKVRLGQAGDTCIDNSGKDAPYVVVTSLFDPGVYRVQPGQRVMLQHGSLNEVVDHEKEPCGCPPPPTKTSANEFPLAQSEGLEPLPPAPATTKNVYTAPPQVVPPLVYSGGQQQAPAAVTPPEPVAASEATTPQPASITTKKKPGVFTRLGHFFRRVFGAE